MMNQEQFMSILRWAVSFGAGYALAHGWINTDTVTLVIGAVASLGPLIWGIIRHTKVGEIIAVNNMPEVRGVITTPTAAGVALAAAVPEPNVQPAGTVAAQNVAQ